MANNLSSKPILVANAEIKQVAVTINVMSVNKKQMTLSVFRQLERTYSIIQDDGTLDQDFSLWGIVRYAVNDCHIWVVASRAGSLFRFSVPDQPNGSNLIREYNKLLKLKESFENWVSWIPYGHIEDNGFYKKFIVTQYEERFNESFRDTFYFQDHAYGDQFMREANAMDIFSSDEYLNAKRAELDGVIKGYLSWITKHQNLVDSYTQIMRLPQLFIAV